MKKFLIILLILVFSLPVLVSFLYSVSVLCEMSGCGMCGVIGHHIEKWLGSFLIIAIIEIGLILIVFSFVFSEKIESIKKYIIFDIINPLLIDPIKRLYAKGILEPQIYS